MNETAIKRVARVLALLESAQRNLKGTTLSITPQLIDEAIEILNNLINSEDENE